MSLDKAWAAAQMALPEGAYAGFYKATREKWAATYQHDYAECPKCGTLHQCTPAEVMYVVEFGDTPEEALYNLANKLNHRVK
jgi:hypothetical protein